MELKIKLAYNTDYFILSGKLKGDGGLEKLSFYHENSMHKIKSQHKIGVNSHQDIANYFLKLNGNAYFDFEQCETDRLKLTELLVLFLERVKCENADVNNRATRWTDRVNAESKRKQQRVISSFLFLKVLKRKKYLFN
ncbi:MAG TPA: hypothetical protein VNZ49_09625 [Bacteroidia bacterium]|jgi:hypothetical protein|nr:hypothetical protein [Bacteroidia bacterium]